MSTTKINKKRTSTIASAKGKIHYSKQHIKTPVELKQKLNPIETFCQIKTIKINSSAPFIDTNDPSLSACKTFCPKSKHLKTQELLCVVGGGGILERSTGFPSCRASITKSNC